MRSHGADGCAQRTVGRHQAVVTLRVEPLFELVHQRLALRLVVRQARLGAQCIRARLLVVVEHLADHLTHHLAFVGTHCFQVTKLATAVCQTVTPKQPRLIGHRVT